MPRSIATLLGLTLLAGAAQAQMAGMPMPPPRSITVAGTGTVSGTPDKAELRLTVQKSNASMDKARADAVAVVQRFLALTKKLGIPETKVRTTSAMVNPDYRWDQPTSRQVLVGYVVQRELEVEVTDLDKLGALVEGAVDAGVNNVTPPVLDSTKRRDLNRQALAAAAKDAEANARAVAETLGVKLGSLRELTAAGATPPRPPMPMAMMKAQAMEAADAGGAASYAPGSLEFEASVTATFDVATP
jgi:uncharacterized protein